MNFPVISEWKKCSWIVKWKIASGLQINFLLFFFHNFSLKMKIVSGFFPGFTGDFPDSFSSIWANFFRFSLDFLIFFFYFFVILYNFPVFSSFSWFLQFFLVFPVFPGFSFFLVIFFTNFYFPVIFPWFLFK